LSLSAAGPQALVTEQSKTASKDQTIRELQQQLADSGAPLCWRTDGAPDYSW
jgi:hypothetical protein